MTQFGNEVETFLGQSEVMIFDLDSVRKVTALLEEHSSKSCDFTCSCYGKEVEHIFTSLTRS